jgi:nicotinamide phosphoribosyltransferase
MTEYLPELKESIMAREGRVVIRPDSGDPVDIICGDPIEMFKTREATIYKGAYEVLWDIFGGTINEKGYKVLDPHVGLIYGDSITLERQKEILSKLEAKGFAASNLVFGIGSYTYALKTRDTYGIAMKATYGELRSLKMDAHNQIISREIYKDPVTDSGMKKSAKGLLQVNDGVLRDQCTWEEERMSDLHTVFENGNILVDESFETIRERLLNQTVNKS